MLVMYNIIKFFLLCKMNSSTLNIPFVQTVSARFDFV